MSLVADKHLLTREEYLEGERVSPTRHEYIAGEVFAMSGASLAHATVVANLITLLRPHIRGGPCRVYSADVKVQVEAADAYYYPDLLVSCDEGDRQGGHVIHRPQLVMEVLSPSTCDFDIGKKRSDYQTLNSLVEYVVVAQDGVRVERYARWGPLRWVQDILGPGDTLLLDSVHLSIPVEALYEDVPFDIDEARGEGEAESSSMPSESTEDAPRPSAPGSVATR